jgi:rsbT co-antagonist protein RsbR
MSIAKYRENFFVNGIDILNVQQLGEVVSPHLPEILKKFYTWMSSRSENQQFFENSQHQQQTEARQLAHWQFFFKAELNEEYLAKRRQIGETHWRIGLSLESYFSGMTVFSNLFSNLFRSLSLDSFDNITSFQKLINTDSAIISDTYNSLLAEAMRQQNEALRQLSTPIAQLWEGILLLPLVGIVDSTRAQDILNAILTTISSTQSKAFILDIGGVAVVDTAVANHLIKITKATRLMGCRCILSGISPAVAQTIIELGIQVDEIETTANMKDALQQAFNFSGIKLKMKKV